MNTTDHITLARCLSQCEALELQLKIKNPKKLDPQEIHRGFFLAGMATMLGVMSQLGATEISEEEATQTLDRLQKEVTYAAIGLEVNQYIREL